MKKKTWIKLLIGLLCIVVAMLSFVFYALLFGDIDINQETINKTYTQQFQEISIENEVGEINIECWNHNEFSLSIDAKQEEATIHIDKNTLSINVKQNKFFGIHSTKSNDITLKIPDSYAGKLIMNNHVGDINVDQTNASIEAKSNVGDINIKQGKNLILQSNVGDIEIQKGLDYVEIDSDTGDVDIDTLVLTRDSNITGNLGDVDIQKIDNVYIDAKASTGKMTINHNDRNANIVLKIKTSTGNIDIN